MRITTRTCYSHMARLRAIWARISFVLVASTLHTVEIPLSKKKYYYNVAAREYTKIRVLCALCFVSVIVLGSRRMDAQLPAQAAVIDNDLQVSGTINGSVQQLCGTRSLCGPFAGSDSINGTITETLEVPGTPTAARGRALPPTSIGNVVFGRGLATPSFPMTVPNDGRQHITTLLERSPAPRAALASLFPTFSPGTADVSLTGFLSPGSYNNLSISTAGTLILGQANSPLPEVYNFNNFQISGGLTLQIDGPVVLNVASSVMLSGVIGNTGDPLALTINVANGSVFMAGSVSLSALVQAPNGEVVIGGGSQITGCVKSAGLVVQGTLTGVAGACGVPPGSCLPANSLTVLVPNGTGQANVYVPNGSWEELVNGIKVAQIEPKPASLGTIATLNPVNSCAANYATGQVVCTSNGTDVYVINTTATDPLGTLISLTDNPGSGFENFSGGSCNTCGVAVDPTNDTAILEISNPSGSGGAFQILHLDTNSFDTPVPVPGGANTAENILEDPIRRLVLSPNEQSNYVLFQTDPIQAVFNLPVSPLSELDSAAEDCSTGIAIASDEFTGNLFLADLSQASFGFGTWTAPNKLQFFPQFASFAAGTDGIAVAPGSHLGIVTGEFAGSVGFGVFQLPSTVGTLGAPPSIPDWVAAVMPNDPTGAPWTNGLDPHTVTAYISPQTGNPMAVIVNDTRTFVAVIDLAKMLAATRTSLTGSHTVDGSVNLVSSGIVQFVAL